MEILHDAIPPRRLPFIITNKFNNTSSVFRLTSWRVGFLFIVVRTKRVSVSARVHCRVQCDAARCRRLAADQTICFDHCISVSLDTHTHTLNDCSLCRPLACTLYYVYISCDAIIPNPRLLTICAPQLYTGSFFICAKPRHTLIWYQTIKWNCLLP